MKNNTHFYVDREGEKRSQAKLDITRPLYKSASRVARIESLNHEPKQCHEKRQ